MDKSSRLQRSRKADLDAFFYRGCFGGKGSPPPAPDYTAAAREQGAANIETARAQGRMSNPNVVSPLGTQTVEWGAGTPQTVFDEQGYNQALSSWNQARQGQAVPQPDQSQFFRSVTNQTAPTTSTSFDQAAFDRAMSQYNEQMQAYSSNENPRTRGEFPTAPERNQFNQTITNPGQSSTSQVLDEQAYQRALSDWQRLQSQGPGTEPTREQFTRTEFKEPEGEFGPDQPTITQTLTPEGQQRFDQEQRIIGQLGGMAERGLSRVDSAMAGGFNPNLPALQSGFSTQYQPVGGVGQPGLANTYQGRGQVQFDTGFNQPLQTSLGASGDVQNRLFGLGDIRRNIADTGQQLFGIGDAGSLERFLPNAGNIQNQINPAGSQRTAFDDVGNTVRGFADVGGPQRGVDFSGAPMIPGVNDFSTDRQRVEEAILSRVDPQFQRDEDALRTRLVNQGLRPGTEAWDAEFRNFANARNDARMQAVLAGGTEQSRMANLAMSARGQLTNEALQQGQFANTAQQQAYGQAQGRGSFENAAQQQAYQQALGRGGFENQAQQQMFAQEAARQDAINRAQQQQFGQNLSGGQFANQAQGQAFGQEQARTQVFNQAQQQEFAQAQAEQQAENAAQQQQYQQALGQGQFANTAQQQRFAQGLAGGQFQNQAQQQAFQQAMAEQAAFNAAQQQAEEQAAQRAAFFNQAQGQQFTQGVQNAQLANSVQAQMAAQAQQQAAFANQARQQAIQEALMQRQLPLNEVSALRSGSQLQLPQFAPFQPVGNIQPPPIFNAAQQQAQYNQGLYGLEVGQANSATSGLATLGAAGITAFF